MRAVATPVWTELFDVPLLERKRLDTALSIADPKVMKVPRLRRLVQMKVIDGREHFLKVNDTNGRVRIATGLLRKLLAAYPGLPVEDRTMTGFEESWEAAKQAALNVTLNGIEFSQHQRCSIVSCVTHRRGIVKLATNAGKTEVAGGLIKAIGLKTLYVIHLKGLLHQTADRLELRLGVPVGRIGDGIDKPQALVDVATMQSIKPTKKGMRKRLAEYNVVIFDEAHHLSSNTQQSISRACVNAPFRYAFGGSFPEDEIKRLKIASATDVTLLYDLTNQELISTGWSAKPTVHINKIHHPDFDDEKYVIEQGIGDDIPADAEGDEGDEQQTERRVLFYKIDEDLISNNPKVDEIVTGEIEKLFMNGMTTLVLVDRINHGYSLGRKLGGKGIKYEFLNGSHDSAFREAKLREFRDGSLPVIIATSILDEGIDVPRVQAVVLAGGGKSSVKVLQRVGRALRRKQGIGENVAHIVDFHHTGSRYTAKHARARLMIYQKEQFDIVEDGKFTV